MGKFKVGDKVLVKPNPKELCGIPVSEVKSRIGKIHTITKEKINGWYRICMENEEKFTWREDMLIPLPEPGDKVKIRTWEDMESQYGSSEYGIIYTPGLSTHLYERDITGEIVDVLDVDTDETICVPVTISLTRRSWIAFACIEEVYKKEDKKEMSQTPKSYLQNGRVVEYRNGDRRMVVGDSVYSGSEMNEIIYYNDDLKEKFGNSEIDICTIYEPGKGINIHEVIESAKKVVWKREESKEITAEEAFKVLREKYGTEVKIIGDMNR